MVCKRCGCEINRAKGWRCVVRPELTCVGWTGNIELINHSKL